MLKNGWEGLKAALVERGVGKRGHCIEGAGTVSKRRKAKRLRKGRGRGGGLGSLEEREQRGS
jgi:hypothetical protein